MNTGSFKNVINKMFTNHIHFIYACYIIAEWFFYLIIFVNYILSFGLFRLWTIRLLVQVFTLMRGGCDNHKCHNKNIRWKWDWGVNDVMPGSDGLGILVIFEKSSELRFEPGREQSSWGLRDARRVCWVS